MASRIARAGELVSAAKAFIGDYGVELIQDCVQIHGGIGVTFDHDIHLYLRRHTVNRALYGTPAEHRQRLTDHRRVAGRRRRERATTWRTSRSFRPRARLFDPGQPPAIGSSTDRVGPLRNDRTDEEELAAVARDRELQRMLFDGGFAGICFPREYGGQGLTPAHQRALNEEIAGYEYPARLQAPTFSPCAAVMLDFGTEEQKQRHIPAILKGEEIWMQFLSEPSGGSDVAGALTTRRARRRRMGAQRLEDLDHRRLVVRLGAVPGPDQLGRAQAPRPDRVHAAHPPARHRGPPDRDAQRLEGVLPGVPDRRAGPRHRPDRRGRRRLDRRHPLDVPRADAHQLPLVTVPAGDDHTRHRCIVVHGRGPGAGRLDDPCVRDLVGEARMLELVDRALQRRIGEGIASGAMSDQAAAIGRLFSGCQSARIRHHRLRDRRGGRRRPGPTTTANSPTAVRTSCMRQVSCIGGGTTEMARNVISERVLGMPRERTLDRDVAFRDVPRGGARS